MSNYEMAAEVDSLLAERRLLTEVDHLLAARSDNGTYQPEALKDVTVNLYTAVQEMSMPFAVSETRQEFVEIEAAGRRHRILQWLGRSAVQVAQSGYEYHTSQPAFRRIEVEVAEAHRNERLAEPGMTQVFVSPRMSRADAPSWLAKQEHLHDDDAIRTSQPLTDAQGRVVGRRLQSLLVRDVPLEAWVAMLEDDSNIFGRSLPVQDKTSAVSVMELFDQLDLPDTHLPEGPITILAAVVPYISDTLARQKVAYQLARFRQVQDQRLYESQARRTAEKWLEFECQLADSLASGWATLEIERFIASLQAQWSDEVLELIDGHYRPEAGYVMSRQLAACLEKAQQNLLNGEAAIITKNDYVLGQMDEVSRQRIVSRIQYIESLETAGGAGREQIARLQTDLWRDIANQSLRVGGGCPGKNEGSFGSSADDLLSGEQQVGGKEVWTWKSGVCRVKSCPSPKPTEVGPCNVCRNCQHVFDSGGDPTKAAAPPRDEKVKTTPLATWLAKRTLLAAA